MRSILVFMTTLAALGCASKPHSQHLSSLTYNPADLRPQTERELSHDEQNENKSYLAMPLPFPPFDKLRQEIERSENLSLKNRGEAHITVITPPEFKVLQKKISMKEVTQIAAKMKLQETPVKPLCVGKGSLKDSKETKETFFVVVQADRLFEIREALQKLYVSRGGNPGDFSPELFYPHVTLGFTQRDLHFEDGVIKDASSCRYSLRPLESTKNQ